jgi:Fur family peroxide stress response transcriptional regulator
MTTSKLTIDQRMQSFGQACKKANIKLTFQRMEIFREIAISGDHPDVKSVFQRVKKRIPTISLDTVYRALWLFTDLGLIKTLGTTRERTRFDANLDQHHHFICTVCGLMRDFYSKDFDGLGLPESVKEIGQASSTHVEVRGVCKDCYKKIKTTKSTKGVCND